MEWAPGYREFAPSAWLRGTLACLWVGITSPVRAERTLVLPDACVDLIWCQGADPFLAGPDTGPAPIVQPPGSVIVGARFRPGAGGTVLGLPLTEIADQRVGTDQVPALRGRMPSPDLPPDRVFPELARLVASLAADRPAPPELTSAVRLLASPDTSAEDVAGSLDLSERQLRRRFQAAVGYGPGTLQRVIRFRRFVSAVDAATVGGTLAVGRTRTAGRPGTDGIASFGTPARAGGPGYGDATLAELAVLAGYADQPHLTRECVRLSGLTPAALARARAS